MVGLNNEKIQQILLAETDLTFDKAVNIATARETAYKDVQAMTSGLVNYIPESQSGNKKYKQNINIKNKNLHKPNNVSVSAKFSKPTNSNSNDPKTPCSGCGRLHWKHDYPFKNATCHGCKQNSILRKCVFRLNLGHPQRNLNLTN